MGVGASQEFHPPPTLEDGRAKTEPARSQHNGHSRRTSLNGRKAHSSTGPTNGDLTDDDNPKMKLLGKDKYIKEYGALAMDDRNDVGEVVGTFIMFLAPASEDLTLVYRESKNGQSYIYARSFSDVELGEAKTAAGVRFSWAPFFKSLATAVIKSKVVVRNESSQLKVAHFVISNTKIPAHTFPFAVPLTPVVPNENLSQNAILFAYAMEPMTRMLQCMRQRNGAGDREAVATRIECEIRVRSASIRRYRETVSRLLPLIRPLREESAVHSHLAMSAGREVRDIERRLRAQLQKPIRKHPLDSLYDDGGAQYFRHTIWSSEHVPHQEAPDDTLASCIRAAFPLQPGTTLSQISQVLDRPDIKKLVEASPNRQMISEAFDIFKGIDQWDYDTIQLEIITNGNALFYTAYVLMYKLDLVNYFKINDQTLRSFLIAVQAAYHPNPYHNAMHGADVTQINYYIMMVGGLCEKCKLSNEEILAGLLAGSVHDFDHPGLNNNFHQKTNAYLATLYNDRSILENHHIACTFELLRHPKYNVLASLRPEQRQIVRDTMLEMVLATDMGRHGKIFKHFQMRMAETTDWHSKKEDVRLALSMSIKMADISNCARPSHIYAEWAKNISKEFYTQGDAERKLDMPISPFMDRTKESEEFPRGQISFMIYVVQPMVEAIAELLPNLSFAVNFCVENKEYWEHIVAEERRVASNVK